jgi:hypothetical protein
LVKKIYKTLEVYFRYKKLNIIYNLLYLIALAFFFVAILFFVKKCRVQLKQDFILIAFLLLSIVYIIFVPAFNFFQLPDGAQKRNYLKVTLYILYFFYAPFLLFSFFLRSRKKRKVSDKISISSKKASGLAFSLFFFTILFLWISIRQNIFFSRAASYDTELKTNLSFFDFLIYNSFVRYGSMIISFLYLIQKFSVNKNTILRLSTALFTLVYILFCIVNSRQMIFVFLFQFIGFFFFFNNNIKALKKRIPLIIIISAFVSYGIKTTLNARYLLTETDGKVSFQILNPFLKVDENVSESLNTRLDAIFLMAEMTPEAEKKGYAWGKAWAIPLFLIVGPVLYPQEAAFLKATYMTDAESYLLVTYTNLQNSTMDFNSIFLTDAYCNFSALGFLLAAIVFAVLISFIQQNVTIVSGNRIVFILALYFYSKIFVIENELISIPLNFFKAIPVLLVLLIFCPIKVQRNEKN